MDIIKNFTNTKFSDLKAGDLFSYAYRDQYDTAEHTNDVYLVVYDSTEDKKLRIVNLNENQLYLYNPCDGIEVTRYDGQLRLFLDRKD